MSKAGREGMAGMAGMAVSIPSFVKSNVLLDLAVTLPRGCYMHARSNLVEPCSLESMGYYSLVGIQPRETRV